MLPLALERQNVLLRHHLWAYAHAGLRGDLNKAAWLDYRSGRLDHRFKIK
jgi:hypothetical protein